MDYGLWTMGYRHNLLFGIALICLVAVALLMTYRTNTTPDLREATDIAGETVSALEETKLAYAKIDPHPDLSGKTASQKQVVPVSKTSYAKIAQTSLVDKAIEDWRRLAGPGRPAEWRRLGLTLALFNRPGAQTAFQHIADPPLPERSSKVLPISGRHTLLTIADTERSILPATEEITLWKTVFGTQPIAFARVERLRQTVLQLHLGWFENIALENLYLRAGMKVAADQAHRRALTSANQLNRITGGENAIFLIGTLAWCALGLYWFARMLAGYSPETAYPQGDLSPEVRASSSPYREGAERPVAAYDILPPTAAPAATEGISYRARSTGFIVYLALFLFIGLPLRLLHPLTAHLSTLALIRLNEVLQLLIYVPVVWIALLVIRRVSAAESPLHKTRSLREILAAMGMRSARPVADIGAGILAYLMTVPFFLITTLISYQIFRNVHTPVNPIQIEAMWALRPIDQLLMMVETAVAAPIVEELMFRGVLLPALSERWGRLGGIALTSAVFALLHPNLPAGFLPLWTLGAAFAVVTQRRNSLLPNIVMHALHNGYITLTMFFLFAK